VKPQPFSLFDAAPDDLLDLPFDQYTRHRIVRVVAECVRGAQGAHALHVLDVGGYPCLTPRFLPADRVRVVDVVNPRSDHLAWVEGDSCGTENPGNGAAGASAAYIRADGSCLPFKPRAFDLVVSLDSLEHVPPDRRPAYVAELARVSRGFVLILAPFAQDETELAERLLAEFVRVVNREEQPQLREHRAFGLPRLDDWTRFAEDHGLPYVTFCSGFVYNWLPMMLLKHYVSSLPDSEALHRAIDRFYNVTLQHSDAKAPGYRQGLLIAAGGAQSVLQEATSRLAPGIEADRDEVIERMEQIGLLLKLADLHVSSRRDDRLRDDLLAKDRHILNVEHALRESQARGAALEQQVKALEHEIALIRAGRAVHALESLAKIRQGVSALLSGRSIPPPKGGHSDRKPDG